MERVANRSKWSAFQDDATRPTTTIKQILRSAPDERISMCLLVLPVSRGLSKYTRGMCLQLNDTRTPSAQSGWTRTERLCDCRLSMHPFEHSCQCKTMETQHHPMTSRTQCHQYRHRVTHVTGNQHHPIDIQAQVTRMAGSSRLWEGGIGQPSGSRVVSSVEEHPMVFVRNWPQFFLAENGANLRLTMKDRRKKEHRENTQFSF